MIKIVGAESRKVYVAGSREYCFRILQKKYPYEQGRKNVFQDNVYPEPLLVVKV